ncbi:unnamed protein product [Triticum aestivum]|uniref:Uncharacterized protein n=1 Tax=Triticum aestivum TaxID=4565 RepID=A0A7H4LPI3_WHEAT|nr:uncharacterized protein LOC123050376 [Triticum aestivum]SPT20522.1 unnamed protein product [Triticum aestivum]
MVVHVVLLAAPAVGGFLLHAFKFSILLWPFNLTLPLLRDLPRVCATLRGAASLYAAELRASLAGRRRRAPAPQLDRQYFSLRGVRRRPAERLVDHAMLALVDISY